MSGNLSYLLHFIIMLCLCTHAGATTIEGVVVTDQGPLDGAIVKGYLSLRDLLADNNPLISTPGEKPGFFRLDVPEGTYFFTASGTENNNKFYAFHGANPVKVENKPIWLPFAATPLTMPMKKVAETSRIAGRLRYKGKPVSQAQVSLYVLSEKNVRGLGLETKSTDGNGEFRFTPPPGSYLLVARKRVDSAGKRPLSKGDLFCFYGANPLALGDGREISVEISCHPKDDLQAFLAPDVTVKRSRAELARFREREPLKAGMGISGRVTDRDGKPAQDLQVTAYHRRDPGKAFQMHHLRLASENMVRTDANGRYFLPVNKAGSYYLVARQYGGESPLKGELYGLYEANPDHAVTVNQGAATADITVGRVMAEVSRDEPALPDKTAVARALKAPPVIDHDTVWSGEVLIEGALLVARGATLRIAPGTVIRFKRIDRDGDGVGDGEIRVLGRIIARGTPDRPIRFMSAEREPRPGDWSYLLLFTSGEENVIKYTIFEHAFSGLQVHFSRAIITDSVFRNNKEGIRFGRAELVVEHNEIKNNDIGIRYHRLEGPVEIRGNLITENGVGLFLVPSGQKSVDFSVDTYIPDIRYYMYPLVKDNTIADNLRYNYQLGERLSTDIPLEGNWWGNSDVERIRTTVFDREREPELGKVTILPILSSPVKGAGPRKGGR